MSIIDHSGHQGHTHFRQPARHNRPNPGGSRTTRRHRAIALRFGQTSALSNRYSFPIQNQANINRTYQKHHHQQQQQQQQQQQHKYDAYMILYDIIRVYIYMYILYVLINPNSGGSWVFKPVFWQPLTIVLVA